MENEEVKGQLLVSNGALHASDNRENGFHKHNTSAMEANGRHRQQWARETEFILACVGNAVGLGNLWRFPYLCYMSGGGAFLIPYAIMIVVCGCPLLYMEMAVGQLTRLGPVGALRTLCPFLQGAGAATVVLSFLLCTYYNVILTWALYYLFSSFQHPLPWSNCNHTWNRADLCWRGTQTNTTHSLQPNDTISPTQDFFESRVLTQSAGVGEAGSIVWELALLLLFAWVLVYLCLWKGIKLTGKVVYFTATFPYVIILALIIRGLTLPGASEGIRFFLQPRWELLLDPKVWVYAAAQNFNSIGIAFGSMIAFASYNAREQKIFRDATFIVLIDAFTSIFAGIAVFSILGYIAVNQGKDVKDVVTSGPGLVFMVYPEAFSTMPYGVGQLLSVLFFFMLLTLAIDSQFASVEVVITTIEDALKRFASKRYLRRELLTLIVCVVAFLLGLPCITNGGIYYFKIIDHYSSGISLMLIAFFEVVAISWCYGAFRLANDVKIMTGSKPFIYFVVCWIGLSPALILTIMIFNWIGYVPLTYGQYVFPAWAQAVGWGLASLSLICLPIGMAVGFKQSTGKNIWQKVLNAVSPLRFGKVDCRADLNSDMSMTSSVMYKTANSDNHVPEYVASNSAKTPKV